MPIGEEEYRQVIDDRAEFRRVVDRCYQEMPELFPESFEKRYELKDRRESSKTGLTIRRIELRNGTASSIRPSFLMPYLSARTNDAEAPLFLRKFGVPYWALAYVFSHDAMYWYRMETGLGRNSIVETTVRRAAWPEHLLADEHHQLRNGEKKYIATTVGNGVVLGAAVAETARTDDLTTAYAVFREEARNIQPDYAPKSVNTDGWKGTKAAWRSLFQGVLIIQCFLHGLKIRERAKHLKDTFAEISERVWDVYHAPDQRTFSQKMQALKSWATTRLFGIVLEKVVDLCEKRDRWLVAYQQPGCHHTSNMLDRLMRSMNRYFDNGQHLHGSLESSKRHGRSWALLHNFAPWVPRYSEERRLAQPRGTP